MRKLYIAMSQYYYHGGRSAHLLRRLIHISTAMIPVLYYWYLDSIGALLHLSAQAIISMILAIIIIAEIIRLSCGFTVWGQRDYEKKRISAFAWGSLGIYCVLLAAPAYGRQNAALGVPLIWSLAFVDPLMGEARRYGFSVLQVLCCAAAVLLLIWLSAWFWLGTPLWLVPLIVPIVIAAEWPKIPWIDDNFLMLVIPLSYTKLLFYLFVS